MINSNDKSTSFEVLKNLIQGRMSLYPQQMKAGAKIPDEDIWKVLNNANYAPSHKRTEPWRFIVFSDSSLVQLFQEKIRIYKKITPESEFKASKVEQLEKKSLTFSHVIAIYMKRDELERVPVREEEYAVACAVQNILLSLSTLNIIGYWGTGKIAFSQEMKTYLGLGTNDICMGFLQLGVPKEELPSIQKTQMSPIEDKVVWKS